MSLINSLVDKVVEWSFENTSGVVMLRSNIESLILLMIKQGNYNESFVKQFMENIQSEAGYLVKLSDFKQLHILLNDIEIL